jgi:P pilus assembly chaperone PapD
VEHTPDQVALQDLARLIRFSPKVVSLLPKEGQAVRIQVRKPANLPEGEYRLYMVFREEPPPPAEPTAGTQAEAPKAISIRLTSLFGVAIPLIIRHGETSAKAAVAALALTPDRKILSFRLERTGNASVHGDLKAVFQGPSGKPQLLAEINGLAVFPPNAHRNITMPLEAVPHGTGLIQVTFSDPDQQGAAPLAEGTLKVP